jgi:Tfp pilus assembly protein PilN
VRAVNLIPSEAGRSGRAGASTGPYVVLGVLGLLLVGAVAYVLTSNALVERRSELATVQAQAQTAQAQADATRPYREFAALAEARVETVRQLGAARFDWHRAFSDLARVMPENVWLTSLLGTVTTGVSVEGAGSGDTGTLRTALPNPAIELTGCTTGHDQVARLISRLRLVSGVTNVALADSTKDDSGSGGSGVSGGSSDSSGSSDCRYGHDRFPQFGIVVFFEPLPGVPSPTASDPAAAAAAAAGAGATPAPAGTAAPAASTTPAPTGGGPAASSASSGTGNGNGSDVR